MCRTLSSLGELKAQAGYELEVIVADGGTSPDFEKRLLILYPYAIVTSQRDHGIYDGMNRGLGRSNGRFVWFLNGGDECLTSDWPTLQTVLHRQCGKMVYFGYQLAVGRHLLSRKSRPPAFIWHALPTCHQAIVYPGDSARHTQYDLSFQVSGDYALTAQLHKDGVAAVRGPLSLARFYAGGWSSSKDVCIASDARRVQREILRQPALLTRVSSAAHILSRLSRRALAGARGA